MKALAKAKDLFAALDLLKDGTDGREDVPRGARGRVSQQRAARVARFGGREARRVVGDAHQEVRGRGRGRARRAELDRREQRVS